MTKDKKRGAGWKLPLRQFSSESELQQMLAGLLNRIPEISVRREQSGLRLFCVLCTYRGRVKDCK